MGLGRGKEQEGQRGDRAEGRQQVVGKGEEEVQMHEKNPLAKLGDCVREPDCNHGHDVRRGDNLLCDRVQVSAFP